MLEWLQPNECRGVVAEKLPSRMYRRTISVDRWPVKWPVSPINDPLAVAGGRGTRSQASSQTVAGVALRIQAGRAPVLPHQPRDGFI
jgi:hypothetical protein